jgi:hypothetical protein
MMVSARTTIKPKRERIEPTLSCTRPSLQGYWPVFSLAASWSTLVAGGVWTGSDFFWRLASFLCFFAASRCRFAKA